MVHRFAEIFSKKINSPYVFLLPGVVVLFLMTTFPVIYAVSLSFSDFNFLKQGAKFCGLNNYIEVFRNPVIWHSLRITAIYVILSVGIQLVLAVSIANLLNNDFKGKTIVRALIAIPMLLPPIVVGSIWKMFFWSEYGLVDSLLALVGVSGLGWLSSPNIALYTIIFVDIWSNTPFITIIVLAGLEGLPQEPLEAAAVDGASKFDTFVYVVAPQLWPVAMVAVLIRIIDALRAFGLIFVMTAGGPGIATQTMNFSVYLTIFRYFRVGEGSALAVILSIITAVVAYIFIKYTFRSDSNEFGS